MVENSFYEDLITQLRMEKARQGLTVEMIQERTEANGEPVSARTLTRLFSPTSKAGHFQNKTLFSVAHVLGVDPINGEGSASVLAELRQTRERLQAAEALLRVKDDQIQHRTEEISAYTAQVNSMRSTVQTYQRAIKRKNTMLRALVILLLVVAGVEGARHEVQSL